MDQNTTQREANKGGAHWALSAQLSPRNFFFKKNESNSVHNTKFLKNHSQFLSSF